MRKEITMKRFSVLITVLMVAHVEGERINGKI